MTDRPIPFSAPMVAALLAGTKTQTRRALKFQPAPGISIIRKTIRPLDAAPYHSFERRNLYGNYAGELDVRIKRGDRLYVREHWRTEKAYDDLSPSEMGGEEPVRYLADNVLQTWGFPTAHFEAGRHRQAMHMPRWASRLTLIVTDVRVERLQDISEADAVAEGITEYPCLGPHRGEKATFWSAGDGTTDEGAALSSRFAYANLWDTINGPGAWDANPWVVAYTFTVHRGNIDQIGGAA